MYFLKQQTDLMLLLLNDDTFHLYVMSNQGLGQTGSLQGLSSENLELFDILQRLVIFMQRMYSLPSKINSSVPVNMRL